MGLNEVPTHTPTHTHSGAHALRVLHRVGSRACWLGTHTYGLKLFFFFLRPIAAIY
jgi:hypothetical protein